MIRQGLSVRGRRAPHRQTLPANSESQCGGLSWELYDALSDAIDEKQKVFLAYDGKDLEIMVKGREHEDYEDLFGQLVHAIADDLRIPRRGAGETTWKRIELLRGVEADQCYFFTAEKLARDTAARKRRSRNIDDYPNPDLAIEIDMSPPQIDRDAIYAASPSARTLAVRRGISRDRAARVGWHVLPH